MLFYYSTNSTFENKLNIFALFKQVDKNKELFKNVCGIQSYIDNWKKAFLNTYFKEKNTICRFSGTNYFFTSLFIAGYEIRIHFSVDNALLKSKEYPTEFISLNQFTTKSNQFSPIKYTECKLDGNYDYSKCKLPVTIVPYILDGCTYLVIDGNHRITAFKKNNVKDILGILLSPNDAISLINSEFEKAIYLFLYEGSNVESFINNSNYRLFI